MKRILQTEPLLDSEERYALLINSVPQLVWTSGENGACDYVNARMREYTGRSCTELTGMGWLDCIHPDDTALVADAWQKACATSAVFEVENRIRRHDGCYRWFKVRAIPMHGSGGERRWLGTSTDIHDHKMLEAELHKTRDELNALYERERMVSERLQRAFLPDQLPQTAGLRLSAAYVPAATDVNIGGDWYDAVEMRGQILISIGDVAGHGMESAIPMTKVRQTLRAAAHLNHNPLALLRVVNAVLRREHPDVFATGIIGLVDPRLKTLTYVNAGHPRPVLRTPQGRTRLLEGTGMPLGVLYGESMQPRTVALEAGATIVLYTDGLIEADRNLLTGEARLLSVVAGADFLRDANPAHAIVGAMLPHGSDDDVAVLTATL